MIDKKFQVRTLRQTEQNLELFIRLSENSLVETSHILMNDKNIALVTHKVWETCEYCYYKSDENGIIQM